MIFPAQTSRLVLRAKYVYDKGLTDKTTFTLETLSGIKTIDVFLGEDAKADE